MISVIKKYFKEVLLLLFFLIAIISTLALFFQTQVWQKRAQEGPLLVEFDASTGPPLKRIWPYFAQGGEEKELMLAPIINEVRKLQPALIRIDHIFDYSVIYQKDPSGQSTYDFTALDQRIEEILSTGAVPFLSLSYFPIGMSEEITKFPPVLNDWQDLVRKTIQRYSGKNQKNIANIYYEVWNEPDLFGKMGPEKYFSLYQSSVAAANSCQDCNLFVIGGPAITTLKKDWLNEFLKLVVNNNLRLDFVSFHSYQLNPVKTANEVEDLKGLSFYQNLPKKPEIVISESGPIPEVSSLHDSYFSASHLIANVSLLKDSVDKLVTFEIKDGPDPQEKKYWGRWGLITHQSQGVSLKPKFYAFLYLNKLQEYAMVPTAVSPGAWAIGSTDGNKNQVLVISRTNGSNTVPLSLKINNLLPGTYLSNLYTHKLSSQPLLANSNQFTLGGGLFSLDLSVSPNSSFLLELSRLSPATIKTFGISGQVDDFSAKATSFVPPLVFGLEKEKINSLRVGFWFKPTWNETDTLLHTLLETKDTSGNGLTVWIEPSGFTQVLNFGRLSNNQLTEKIQLPLSGWKEISWHEIVLVFDENTSSLSLKLDDQQVSLPFGSSDLIGFGRLLYFGTDSNSQNSAEGSFDKIVIDINNENVYQENFDY